MLIQMIVYVISWFHLSKTLFSPLPLKLLDTAPTGYKVSEIRYRTLQIANLILHCRFSESWLFTLVGLIALDLLVH